MFKEREGCHLIGGKVLGFADTAVWLVLMGLTLMHARSVSWGDCVGSVFGEEGYHVGEQFWDWGERQGGRYCMVSCCWDHCMIVGWAQGLLVYQYCMFLDSCFVCI